MADDKRDGDDLFEDLDKFFAPIKDVDWDEPASAGARETPSEEHVAVRASDPSPADPAPDVEPERSRRSSPRSSWTRTTTTRIGTTPRSWTPSKGSPSATSLRNQSPDDDVVSLDDLSVIDAPDGRSGRRLDDDPAHGGLFAGGDDLGTETAPMGTDRGHRRGGGHHDRRTVGRRPTSRGRAFLTIGPRRGRCHRRRGPGRRRPRGASTTRSRSRSRPPSPARRTTTSWPTCIPTRNRRPSRSRARKGWEGPAGRVRRPSRSAPTSIDAVLPRENETFPPHS